MNIKDKNKINDLSVTLAGFFGESMNLARIKFFGLERAGMKTVVEIKEINKGIFEKLFMFDELIKRFKQDYPNES